MIDQREKNSIWYTLTSDNCYQCDSQYRRASLAVLMDIRDELQSLNRLLNCGNFLNIPFSLREIAKNTTRHKRRK